MIHVLVTLSIAPLRATFNYLGEEEPSGPSAPDSNANLSECE
jgi:hypothetical protein